MKLNLLQALTLVSAGCMGLFARPVMPTPRFRSTPKITEDLLAKPNYLNATFINVVCHDRPYGPLCGSSKGGYCDIDWSGDVKIGECQVWSEPHVGAYSWMISSCSSTNATKVSYPESLDCTGRSVTSYTPSNAPLGKCIEANNKNVCGSSGGTSCMTVCTPMSCTIAIASICKNVKKGGGACTDCVTKHFASLKNKGCTESDLTGFCYSP